MSAKAQRFSLVLAVALLGALSFGTLSATGFAHQADSAPTLSEVQRLLDEGDVQGAAKRAELLVEQQPGNVDAHRLHQDLQVEIGKGSSVLRVYQKGSLAKTASADACYLYARLLEGKKAVAQYRRALAADPKHVRALCGLGTELTRMDEWEDAAATLALATEAAPTSALAFNLRGYAAERMGEFEEAEEHFRKAVTLDPGYTLARVNLALLLFAGDERDEALAELDAAANAAPDDALPHLALGRMYVLIEDDPLPEKDVVEDHDAAVPEGPAPTPEEGAGGEDDARGEEEDEEEETPPLEIALGHFRTAVELSPESVEARTLLAHCTLRIDPYMPMDGHLSRALALDPSFPVTHVLLTAAYLLRLDPEGAEKAASLSLKSGDFAELYYLRGFAKERNMRASKAESDYKKGTKLDPNDPLLMRALGLLHRGQGRWKHAIAAYEAVVKMDGASARSLHDLANLQRAAGKGKDAAKTLERLVAAYPEDLDGWFELGRVCHTEVRRRKSRAAAAYRKYLELGGENENVPGWLAEVEK